MRWASPLCCGLASVLCASARAGDEWTRIEQVETVTVRIHWVSPQELRGAARRVGKKPQSAPLAFSVLRKSTRTDAYSCDIYMPSRLVRIYDKPTASLGHELAHCLGFVHK
jgi:hypothetical protein